MTSCDVIHHIPRSNRQGQTVDDVISSVFINRSREPNITLSVTFRGFIWSSSVTTLIVWSNFFVLDIVPSMKRRIERTYNATVVSFYSYRESYFIKRKHTLYQHTCADIFNVNLVVDMSPAVLCRLKCLQTSFMAWFSPNHGPKLFFCNCMFLHYTTQIHILQDGEWWVHYSKKTIQIVYALNSLINQFIQYTPLHDFLCNIHFHWVNHSEINWKKICHMLLFMVDDWF